MIKDQSYWYPLYTKSRHEKKAYKNLVKAGYETFLPMIKSVRQWSDRKIIVDVPLISSYVFSRFDPVNMNDVLNVYGVSRYISFNGKPAHVRDEEIELLKKAIESKAEIEVENRVLKTWTLISIKSGAFCGYSGKFIRRSGKNKLVIELESMGKTILVTIDNNLLL